MTKHGPDTDQVAGESRTAYVEALVGAERDELLAVLSDIDERAWETPSLCAGWTVRDVVVHVLMPYEMSLPRFLVKIASARFSFDTMADRWARADRRSPAELVQAVRETAARRFSVPGAPAEAPLSHLLLHAEDIYRPLGLTHRLSPDRANLVLDQLVSPRARGALGEGLLDDLTWSTCDTGWSTGSGASVVGTASAVLTTMSGRTAALDELSGTGVQKVRERLKGASHA